MQEISKTLSHLAISLTTLRNNTTYTEFDGILDSIRRANDLGKLEELLDSALFEYSQGTDVVTAFAHAMFDCANPDEN